MNIVEVEPRCLVPFDMDNHGKICHLKREKNQAGGWEHEPAFALTKLSEIGMGGGGTIGDQAAHVCPATARNGAWTTTLSVLYFLGLGLDEVCVRFCFGRRVGVCMRETHRLP